MTTPYKLDRSETFSHCQRVGALARRTSAVLGLGAEVDTALGIAASLHHDCARDFAPGTVARIFESLPGFTTSNEALQLAEEVLRRFTSERRCGSDQAGVAALVLELANEFDEAVEFSVLDGLSYSQAIEEFHGESTPEAFPRHPRSALCQVTRPSRLTVSNTRLPVLPRAIARLMNINDETAPVQIESIAASDPVLAARLLEAANSAMYSSGQTILRLLDAAARIGVPQARKVLMAACVGQLFASSSLKKLWETSQNVAAKAAALAPRAGLCADEAYVAGLLHDVGRLLFERADGSSRVSLFEWLANGFPITYAEALVWATDHAAAGAGLLRGWQLPAEIVEAVECHHRPERSSGRMASVLFLAARLDERDAPDLMEGMRADCAMRVTGITAEDLGQGGEAPLVAIAS